MRCADCRNPTGSPRWRVCLACRNKRIAQGVRFAWIRRKALAQATFQGLTQRPGEPASRFLARVIRHNPTLSMRAAKARGAKQ